MALRPRVAHRSEAWFGEVITGHWRLTQGRFSGKADTGHKYKEANGNVDVEAQEQPRAVRDAGEREKCVSYPGEAARPSEGNH